jgi:DNA-binding NarL/FixJ family response regulator
VNGATRINIFGITDDEQRKLKTIISKDMAKERDAARAIKKRQDAGAMAREEYLSINDDKRATARLMKAQGQSNRAIAKLLDVSEFAVRTWVR